MLSTDLGTQHIVVAPVAVSVIVVTVLVTVYYSASRVKGRFTKKSVKLKLQGSYFCLRVLPMPYSLFYIKDFTLSFFLKFLMFISF